MCAPGPNQHRQKIEWGDRMAQSDDIKISMMGSAMAAGARRTPRRTPAPNELPRIRTKGLGGTGNGGSLGGI